MGNQTRVFSGSLNPFSEQTAKAAPAPAASGDPFHLNKEDAAMESTHLPYCRAEASTSGRTWSYPAMMAQSAQREIRAQSQLFKELRNLSLGLKKMHLQLISAEYSPKPANPFDLQLSKE